MKQKIILSLIPCMLLLTACGATTSSPKTDEEQEIAKIAREIKKPDAENLAALPEKAPDREAEPETEKPVQQKDLPKVDVLMGKTVAEIEAVFGKPNLRRKDRPAEVWQYLTGECALHLIFYPEEERKSGKLTVQHIAMNDRKKAVTADATICFGSQLKKVGDDQVESLS